MFQVLVRVPRFSLKLLIEYLISVLLEQDQCASIAKCEIGHWFLSSHLLLIALNVKGVSQDLNTTPSR